MVKDVYEKLRAHLDSFPTSFPASEEEFEIDLLKKFFTEEEAEIAAYLPLTTSGLPKDSRAVADEMKRDENNVKMILNAMTKKGLVLPFSKEKVKGFFLNPFVPGIMEFNADVYDAEIAQLYEKYEEKFLSEKMKSKDTLGKILPVNRSLSSQTTIHSYENVVSAIDTSTSICVLPCMCRTQKKLAGKGCGKPVNTCIYFNHTADYLIKIGKGKKLRKDEAIDIITEAEDAGLIHVANNSKGILGLCSCCGCCCLELRSIIKMKNPQAVTRSDFRVAVNSDLCAGCGECIERCWFEALSIENEHAFVDLEKCVGCGACAYTCPTEALVMHRKPAEEIDPAPDNYADLISKMGWR